jgi:hypothetical protein
MSSIRDTWWHDVNSKEFGQTGSLQLIPIVLAILEAQIMTIAVPGQPGQPIAGRGGTGLSFQAT